MTASGMQAATCCFRIVHDVVAEARRRSITYQGGGSAANSAICLYLGVTSVIPLEHDQPFERIISEERPKPA